MSGVKRRANSKLDRPDSGRAVTEHQEEVDTSLDFGFKLVEPDFACLSAMQISLPSFFALHL